jgi:hypothetical protein
MDEIETTYRYIPRRSSGASGMSRIGDLSFGK